MYANHHLEARRRKLLESLDVNAVCKAAEGLVYCSGLEAELTYFFSLFYSTSFFFFLFSTTNHCYRNGFLPLEEERHDFTYFLPDKGKKNYSSDFSSF